MRAYIFVNAATGTPADVVQQLRRVLDKIQKLTDVKGTDTHIVCES